MKIETVFGKSMFDRLCEASKSSELKQQAEEQSESAAEMALEVKIHECSLMFIPSI